MLLLRSFLTPLNFSNQFNLYFQYSVIGMIYQPRQSCGLFFSQSQPVQYQCVTVIHRVQNHVVGDCFKYYFFGYFRHHFLQKSKIGAGQFLPLRHFLYFFYGLIVNIICVAPLAAALLSTINPAVCPFNHVASVVPLCWIVPSSLKTTSR